MYLALHMPSSALLYANVLQGCTLIVCMATARVCMATARVCVATATMFKIS
jgi:hypothetical protein